MASLYGLLHRPLSAAAAVAVTTALPDHVFSFSKQSEPDASPPAVPAPCSKPAACRTSISDVSLLLADNKRSVRSSFTISSPAILLTPYQYAKLANPRKNDESSLTLASSQPDGLYRWHLPDPKAYGVAESNGCSKAKSQTVVILLGWLGAKQKHLKKYADWYTSRGFHVVSFTLPLSDIVSYKVGGKVEQNVELLAEHLVDWVSEESGKSLVFHTFSNTGWLMCVLSRILFLHFSFSSFSGRFCC